ncbi:MAG: IclR family transcriptional regulator [Solirubrobacterales bacterium]|nr:IclR family transcriptional regulator [Solirubrobacterales bacterium]
MTIARNQDSQPQGIKSIEVGARVLLALEQGRGPMALTEVARAADLHPAKVHRYLASLVRTGFASQNRATGLYDLGPASRHLGVEALRRTDAVSAVSAHTTELRDQTGHTTNLGVWTDAGPMLVRWDTGAHALPIVIRVGSVLPLLDSAVGCVFLAHLSGSVTREVLRSQQRQGTTRSASAAEIREVKEVARRDRFSQTSNQMIFGLAALAAPVFGPDGALEVVVGLVLPARMMTAAEARRLGATLLATTERASHELGYRGE